MEDAQHFDFVDFLLALSIFACFIVFGICMWLLKREMKKKKTANQKNANKQYQHGNQGG